VGFCVATIKCDCAPRQRFFLALCPLSPAEDGGKPDVSPGKHRVEIDGPLKELLGKDGILGAGLAEMPHSALIGTPGIEACRQFAHRPLLLGVGDGRRNGDGCGLSNFILHRENVGEIAVVALSPDMVAGFGLSSWRSPGRGCRIFGDCLEHVADAEFTPDLFHIDRTALKEKDEFRAIKE
jgi:hypothetical protein